MYLTVGIIIAASVLLAILPGSNSSCNSFLALAEPCGCTISKENLDPICGSDGGTYLNECFLECEKTLSRLDISVSHKGVCQANSRCSCHARYEPVCATNGVTYSNECVLKCNSDKDSSIRISHNGECQGGGESRLISRTVLKTCTCNPASGPMCATNGVTYPNYCVMRCDSEALNDDSIDFAYWGACASKEIQNYRPPKNCKEKPPKQYENRLNQPNQSNPPKRVCDCPLNSVGYFFRCGGTKRDSCVCATQQPKSEQLKNVCNNKDDRNDPLNLKGPQDSKNRCTCAAVHKPVCASNYETYANVCVLQCHAKQDSGIKFLKMGDCSGKVVAGGDPRLVTRHSAGDKHYGDSLLRLRHFRRAHPRRNNNLRWLRH